MRIIAPAFAASALLFAQPVVAGEPTSNESEKSEKSKQAKKAKEEKKICRRVSTGMGSRRTERVCLTREQWIEANNE